MEMEMETATCFPGANGLGKLWVKEMTKKRLIRTKLPKLKIRLVSQKIVAPAQAQARHGTTQGVRRGGTGTRAI